MIDVNYTCKSLAKYFVTFFYFSWNNVALMRNSISIFNQLYRYVFLYHKFKYHKKIISQKKVYTLGPKRWGNKSEETIFFVLFADRY